MGGESRVIVTCMKNECPYILEWIAYHLHIGFTHFVVATNGCSDGTARLLLNLERAGIVTHVRNPPPHRRGPQKSGYFRCRNVPAVLSADWLMTLDADEFVNIYPGNGTLDDLFEAAPGANLISLQWLMFGHNGQRSFEDTPVTAQFTRSAHPLQIFPTILRSFKTIYRNGVFSKIGTHRPNDVSPGQRHAVRWVDGSGNPMPDSYIDRGWAGETDGSGLGSCLGRINHYAVRSVDAFMIKRDRGDVNPERQHVKNQGSGLAYWKLHDWNIVEDRSIVRHATAVAEKTAELKSIGRVAELHAEGVKWHRKKVEELEKREESVKLRQELLSFTSRDRVTDPTKLRAPEPWMAADHSIAYPKAAKSSAK